MRAILQNESNSLIFLDRADTISALYPVCSKSVALLLWRKRHTINREDCIILGMSFDIEVIDEAEYAHRICVQNGELPRENEIF